MSAITKQEIIDTLRQMATEEVDGRPWAGRAPDPGSKRALILAMAAAIVSIEYKDGTLLATNPVTGKTHVVSGGKIIGEQG